MTTTPLPSIGHSVAPAPRPLVGADLCVHCGFCLQACPTYLTLDDENDSPRGRIVLMKALVAHNVSADDDAATIEHLDRCLGCRACETACPSGVPYGQLLEETRAATHERHPLPWISRLVLFVFARPALLRMSMFAARIVRALGVSRALARAPGRFGIAMASLEATRRLPTAPSHRKPSHPVAPSGPLSLSGHRGPAGPTSRGTVAPLDGCVMEGLLAPVNRATERALAHNGYTIRAAAGQVCCGALHSHAGADATARSLARENIAAYERSGADWIAVNSAGCGAAMKEYGHLLADDPAWRDRAAACAARVRDVSELLAEAGPVPATAADSRQVVVDHPCHLLHGQRLSAQPARVLGAIARLNAVELPDAASCCGSAGLYSLAQPQISQQVLAPKLAAIAASGAAVVVTGNPGCLMHIGAGLVRAGIAAETRHPVELLDAAYQRAGKVS